MVLSTADIHKNNGEANYSIHSDIKIIDYISNYVNNDRIDFPKWQRDDCWDDEYRVTLIESIMQKTDLPKIYLSKKVNGEFYLIDGGHRTRTISSYMKNMFAITIDDDKVFYNSLLNSIKQKLII